MGQKKHRHGCLAIWIVLLVLGNAISAVMYITGQDSVRKEMPDIPDWPFPVLMVMSLLNVIGALAVLRWKRWGFYLVLLSSLVAFLVNVVIGVRPWQATVALVGAAVLFYALLKGTDRNRGWPQLE